MTSRPDLIEHIVIAIPRGWQGTLLAALVRAEAEAGRMSAQWKRLGFDPSLDPHGEATALAARLSPEVSERLDRWVEGRTPAAAGSDHPHARGAREPQALGIATTPSLTAPI
jgi:hypothetical protein